MSNRPTKLTVIRIVIFFVLAVSIWLVGTGAPSWLSGLTNGGAGEDDAMAGATAPIYDEQGRYIIFVGEVELRIPDEVLDWTHRPVNPYEILSLTFCWPDVQTYNHCTDYKSRLRVHLQVRSSSHQFPFTDSDSALVSNTQLYGEPIEVANLQVKKYESRPGSNVARYVITRLRNSGRFPLADCDGATCSVSFAARSDLLVTYKFWQSHIDDWQRIDQFVSGQVDKFTMEE